MKNVNLFLITLISVFIIGCSKSNEHEVITERPANFQMPFYGNIDYTLPEVPAYIPVAEEESATTRGPSIKVSPGTNQLQDIIDNAAAGSTIRLLAGTHTEDNTIVVNRKIKLKGEEGATLSLGGALGIYVAADDVKIKDLTINNTGTAVLAIGVEDSEDFEFKRNSMSGFPISIVLEGADKANIAENNISGVDTDNGFGVVAMNGEKVNVWFNDISGSLFGVWACDKKGRCYNNVLHDNAFGLILCKVPEGSFSPFFAGGTGGSDNPGTEWRVKNNEANNNVWGYIVIDGAKDNFLSNNTGSGNLFVDLELAGETNDLFGFTTPTSQGNVVHAGDLDYINCGLDNVVYGGNDVSGSVLCSE